MNTVSLSGRLLERRDAIRHGVPQVRLRVYNEDTAESFEAMVYGRRRVESLPADLTNGTAVVIEGRLTAVYWRTPSAGKKVRLVGIEVFRVHINKEAGEAGVETPALVAVGTDG